MFARAEQWSRFLYFCVTRFISLILPVALLINSIKLFIMKDFFIKTFRGRQFEFTRVLATSFDPWYHISVKLDNVDVKYKMHYNKAGDWKITVERLPRLLYSLEEEFSELLQLNEKPANPDYIRKS